MMKPLFIQDTPANKISFCLLAFFVAVLPFDRIYSELALIVLLIHTLIHFRYRPLADVKQLLIPSLVYLLTLAGTFYSSTKDQAFFEWQIQLAIILFPFIYLFNPLDFSKYLWHILCVLGCSCVITILYLFMQAFRVIAYLRLPYTEIFSGAFINQNFSLPIDLHATYFSLYIGLSITAFTKFFLQTKSKRARLFYLICLLVLGLGAFQLASRSVWIGLTIILLLPIPFFVIARRSRVIYLTISIALLAIIGGFINYNTVFRNRYLSGLKEDLNWNVHAKQLLEPRALRWECAIDLVKRSPVMGYGTGTEVSLLKQEYFNRHYYGAYVHELNAHNEYLSILIKFGAIGLLIFLFMLYKAFASALRNKDAVYCGFLVLLTTVGFSENFLDVNKGIFFFAVFFSLFGVIRKPKEA